jgi:hypothetical protein
MKKQLLLLALILIGAACFPSLNNNGLNACDKNCHAACSAIKTNAVTNNAADGQDEYDRTGPLQFPFMTFYNRI